MPKMLLFQVPAFLLAPEVVKDAALEAVIGHFLVAILARILRRAQRVASVDGVLYYQNFHFYDNSLCLLFPSSYAVR